MEEDDGEDDEDEVESILLEMYGIILMNGGIYGHYSGKSFVHTDLRYFIKYSLIFLQKVYFACR